MSLAFFERALDRTGGIFLLLIGVMTAGAVAIRASKTTAALSAFILKAMSDSTSGALRLAQAPWHLSGPRTAA